MRHSLSYTAAHCNPQRGRMAISKERADRLDALARLVPPQNRNHGCPDPATLLGRAAGFYTGHASDDARLRAIQRDLTDLVYDDRIEVVNPGGKPLRYRRTGAGTDPYVLEYARKNMRALIASSMPLRRSDVLWQELLGNEYGLGLDDQRLRIISDNQRLLPAAVRESVLADVLEALALTRTLVVGYRDAHGQSSRPTLHPQGLLQRGPRMYLFALKNDEDEPLRMYALHRMTRSRLGEETARQAPGFDLQAMIDRGTADFAGGEQIDLHLRLRGYVTDLLRDCPLAANQRIIDEPDDSDFEARLEVRLPGSGQLLRWLLGCGDNIEVLAPPDLREAVKAQSRKMARLYARRSG